jgi:hypothetical protein
MNGNDEPPRTAGADVQCAPELNTNTLTPEHRAIERIKPKATGVARAGSFRVPADGAVVAHQHPASEFIQLQLARKCTCADAEVKAYREGAEWICHTCGYELTAAASARLAIRRRMR